MLRFAGLGLLASLAACDGSSSGSFDELALEMEGIYQVSAYTRNDTACAPGGSSVLGSDRFAVLATQELFGQRILQAISCASVADCRDKLAQLAAGGGFAFEFSFAASSLGTNGTLLGQGASTGFDDDGVCVGGELTTTTFALVAGGIQIEQAITPADDHPVDGDGFCTTSATQRAAGDNACSEMEVLTAELVEPL